MDEVLHEAVELNLKYRTVRMQDYNHRIPSPFISSSVIARIPLGDEGWRWIGQCRRRVSALSESRISHAG